MPLTVDSPALTVTPVPASRLRLPEPTPKTRLSDSLASKLLRVAASKIRLDAVLGMTQTLAGSPLKLGAAGAEVAAAP